MDGKVRIGEQDTRADAVRARNEEQRADAAVRELSAIKRRLHEFYNEIDHVEFPDAETAPVWAVEWFDYLLDGAMPPTAPAEPETDPAG